MTLIEILVVITIIGILMAIVTINVVPVLMGAKRDAALTQIRNFETTLKAYYAKKGRYPDTGAGLKALAEAQLMEKIPRDPWGNEYVYLLEAGKPVIISYGEDGSSGGEGDKADISSKDEPQAKQ